MKFGYFDDANQEYVITTPKTPLGRRVLSRQRGRLIFMSAAMGWVTQRSGVLEKGLRWM